MKLIFPLYTSRKSLLLFISFLSLFFYSCDKEETIFFNISVSEISLNVEGGERKIEISTNKEWKISIEANWIAIDKTTGVGGDTLVLQIDPNTTNEERNTELIISSGTVSKNVIIKQSAAYLTLNTKEIVFDKTGTPVQLEIKSNHIWTLSKPTSADWCDIDILEGKGDEIITLTPRSLAEGGLRDKTTLIFTCFPNSTELIISQDVDIYKDGEYMIYQTSSTAFKPVHLVIIGDGFVKADYLQGGAFDKAAETAIEAFFSVEPYPTYRDYFTVYKVAGYSEERGATVKSNFYNSNVKRQTCNTLFESVLDGGYSTGISCNYNKVFEYAGKIPAITSQEMYNTTIILIINLEVYAGTCVMWTDGRSIGMCPMGSTFEEIVSHEVGGHGFAKLMDEYVYYNEEIPSEEKSDITTYRWYAGGTWNWGANISLTNNTNSVHWKHYFSQSGYGAVGLYEGADTYSQGIWRPEHNSCMNNNIPYYNAPSREAIVRRIMTISGKGFDINEFYKNDHTRTNAYGAKMLPREDFRPLGPPIIMDR